MIRRTLRRIKSLVIGQRAPAATHPKEPWIGETISRGSLEWTRLPPGPFKRLDAGVIQIGHLLYCMGGYEDQEHVLNVMDVFDLDQCKWIDQIRIPSNIPQSHLALACENGRYIYSAGGQLGPRCKPAIADVNAFDVDMQTWHALPPLPEPRYAATMQLWQGRLHLIGGARPDRYTPARDHWSLAVENGQAAEGAWHVELPIPRGGMHRASAIVHNQLYVFGGQEGDFIAIPGDPDYSCTGNTVEHIHAEVYRLNPDTHGWDRLPDMPVPSSHTEFSIIVDESFVYIVGGSCYKDPQTFEIKLTDLIQAFDTQKLTWSIAGRLPFRVKTCVTGYHDGWLYISAGQRDQSANDPRPGAVENSTWRAKLIHQ